MVPKRVSDSSGRTTLTFRAEFLEFLQICRFFPAKRAPFSIWPEIPAYLHQFAERLDNLAKIPAYLHLFSPYVVSNLARCRPLTVVAKASGEPRNFPGRSPNLAREGRWDGINKGFIPWCGIQIRLWPAFSENKALKFAIPFRVVEFDRFAAHKTLLICLRGRGELADGKI